MRNWILAGGMALLAITMVAEAAVAQGGGGDVIVERKEGLRRMGDHMDAIKAVVDAGGDTAPLVARAEDMVTWFEEFPALFPPGSDAPRGRGRNETRAQPAVWSDTAGFERASVNMVAAAQALRSAAASGDASATASALQEAGATCGACHRAFRAR